jgi:hypothetical protein
MKSVDKLVEVVLYDATAGEQTDNNPKSLKDYLTKRGSYGRIFQQDKDGIVLIQSEDELGIEYIAIPNTWIIKQRYYNK